MLSIYESEPCGDGVITEIETNLGIQLPDDFKEVAKFYSGGFLCSISHHEIASFGEATNIVRETLRLRESIGIADNYLVIAEPSESLIVLNTKGKPIVIWCYAVGANNINSGRFSNKPDTLDDYGEFFEYLLAEEEGE